MPRTGPDVDLREELEELETKYYALVGQAEKLREERDALAAALSALRSAAVRYAEHHGPCCYTHDPREENEPCELCDIDKQFNYAFGEAMGSDKPLVTRDAEQRKAGAVAALKQTIVELNEEYLYDERWFAENTVNGFLSRIEKGEVTL